MFSALKRKKKKPKSKEGHLQDDEFDKRLSRTLHGKGYHPEAISMKENLFGKLTKGKASTDSEAAHIEPPHDLSVKDLLDPSSKLLPIEKFERVIKLREHNLHVIKTNYLNPLTSHIQHTLSRGHPVTLADYTRHLRLSRVLEVADQSAVMDRVVEVFYQNWLEGVAEVNLKDRKQMDAFFRALLDLHCKDILATRATWSLSDNVLARSCHAVAGDLRGVSLEKKITSLHNSVERTLLLILDIVDWHTHEHLGLERKVGTSVLTAQHHKGCPDQRWSVGIVEALVRGLPPKYLHVVDAERREDPKVYDRRRVKEYDE